MRAQVIKAQTILHHGRDLGVYQLRAGGVTLAEVTNGRGEPDWIGRAASEICRLAPRTVEDAREIMRANRRK